MSLVLIISVGPCFASCDSGSNAPIEEYDVRTTDADSWLKNEDESSGDGNVPRTIKTVGSGYTSYFTGSIIDVKPVTTPLTLLVGGGLDRDDAMQLFVDRAGRGNILILRESGSDGYNTWLFAKGAKSVQTIVITSVTGANSIPVITAIRNAEGIFFAGGDQSNYVRFQKNTAVESEVNAAVARGIPVGGTSAGLAILGQYVYSAETLSTTSANALANPYIADITLTKDFLDVSALSGVITDSHFATRDRMGRLITFMARIIKDGWAPGVKGIGVEEGVAIGINQNGIATVFASEGTYAYPLQTRAAASVCLAGTPLSIKEIEAYKIGNRAEFDFNTWTVVSGASSAPYSLSVNSGLISSTNGSIY